MNTIGKIGENIAAKYVAGLSYLIIAKNYRIKFDEIDLIARENDGQLIFIEVKTLIIRDLHNSFMPEDHLTQRKLKSLRRGAQLFLARHPHLNTNAGWRIDLIAISMRDERSALLRHYKNL